MAKAHVLVVEDDEIGRDALVELLEHEGYEVAWAENEPDAFRAFAARRPDLVVLDPLLGTEMAEKFLAMVTGLAEPVPIFLVSATNDSKTMADRYQVELLVKPFDLDDLLEIVAGALAVKTTNRPPPIAQ